MSPLPGKTERGEEAGSSHPLGATLSGAGANFSLFSRSATRVELLFFDRADDARSSRTIELDPRVHRTYHYWHASVPGVKAGQLYGYRAHGPSEQPAACGSIPRSCCWIRMVAAS